MPNPKATSENDAHSNEALIALVRLLARQAAGGCIEFLKTSGVFDRSKNFCTKLRGDAGPVFAAVGEAFLRFGAPQGHVALDLKVSANSPSAA